MLVFRAQKTSQLTCEPLLALFFGMARSSQWNFPGTPFGHRPTWHLLGCCGTARGSVDGTVVLHLKSRSVTSFLLELRRLAWPLHRKPVLWSMAFPAKDDTHKSLGATFMAQEKQERCSSLARYLCLHKNISAIIYIIINH